MERRYFCKTVSVEISVYRMLPSQGVRRVALQKLSLNPFLEPRVMGRIVAMIKREALAECEAVMWFLVKDAGAACHPGGMPHIIV